MIKHLSSNIKPTFGIHSRTNVDAKLMNVNIRVELIVAKCTTASPSALSLAGHKKAWAGVFWLQLAGRRDQFRTTLNSTSRDKWRPLEWLAI